MTLQPLDPSLGTRPLRGVIREYAAILAGAGVASATVDAELLIAFAAGVNRAELQRAAALGWDAQDWHGGTWLALCAQLVDRRVRREPLQHILGVAPFRHLELAVGPGVFVPRPETEQVAQRAIDEATAVVARTGQVVVADLCAGSGALALAIASEVPHATVWAVELDQAAFKWLSRNVAAISPQCTAIGSRVVPLRGDARRCTAAFRDDGVPAASCDVVVSNPPYIPPRAIPQDPEVAEFDPPVALYGLGEDGLAVPRGVVASAASLLRPGGVFVMEHAEVQAEAARALFPAGVWQEVATYQDLSRRDRMVSARLSDSIALS